MDYRDSDSFSTFKNPCERKIIEAFLRYETDGAKVVDSSDIGNILRSLGCAPSEKEIDDFIKSTEHQKGRIHLVAFMNHLNQLLLERKMEPSSAVDLFEAFKVFDPEKKGYIGKDEYLKIMKEYGGKMTDKQIEEMLNASVDPSINAIPYLLYIRKLTYKTKESIYDMAEAEAKPIKPRVSARKLAKIKRFSKFDEQRASGKLMTRTFRLD